MSNANILAKLATGASSIPFTFTSSAPQISLSNGTSNWLAWNSNGVAAPTFTTRSAGTKLVLWPGLGASSVDYAIGIENSTQWFSVDTTSAQFKWYGGTTQAMVLSGAGALTTTGSTTSTAFVPTGSSVPTNGMYLITTNTVGFGTNSAERMRVSDLGNVAIGTTNTGQAKLSVQGVAGANTVGELYLTDSTQWLRFATNLSAGSYNGLVSANDQAILFSDGTPGTGSLVLGAWSTGGAQGVKIDQTGNTSINLSSVTTGYRLDVGGSVRVAGGMVATGEVTAYFSDARLKANITAITNAVDKVMAINGVYYHPNQLAADLTGDKITDQKVGLLAQEVEAVMPHVIRTAPFDIGDNGVSKTGENYKTLQYERMVPLLVEAIKEQKKTIDELAERVSALETMVNDLRRV